MGRDRRARVQSGTLNKPERGNFRETQNDWTGVRQIHWGRNGDSSSNDSTGNLDASRDGISVSSQEETTHEESGESFQRDNSSSAKERDGHVRIATTLANHNSRRWQHRWGKRPNRNGTVNHYATWKREHHNYLNKMFDATMVLLSSRNEIVYQDIDYSDFVNFAYFNSTGYISPYL